MSREKQIEEMAKAIYELGSHITYWHSSCTLIAEALYNAGYRKSADLVEEIFAEIDKLLAVDSHGEATLDVRKLQILQMKYTESEKDNGKK